MGAFVASLTLGAGQGLSIPIDHVVLLALALFSIGLIGVTCRRNVLIVLLSVEIMLNAANLALVAFSRLHNNLDGQIMVFFAMVVAAAEVAVGLAIIIAIYRLRQSTDINENTELHDVDYGPVPPLALEGEDHHHDHDHHDDHGDPHDGGQDDATPSEPVAVAAPSGEAEDATDVPASGGDTEKGED